MSAATTLYRFATTAATSQEPLLEEIAALSEFSWTSWRLADSDQIRFEAYFESPDEATLMRDALVASLAGAALATPLNISPVEPVTEDWQTAWKDFFHAERVSERIIITPTWETPEASADDVVVQIDPGMSFGTGQHGTTKACLQFIEQCASAIPGGSFLDLGCGSGVLAIAASKLGCKPVAALDIDPIAVAATRENAVINGVGEAIVCEAGNVEQLEQWEGYHIVVANILAPVLIANAPAIAQTVAVATGSRLILAGILTTQYAAVHATFAALGFEQLGVADIDEWRSGLFERR